MIYFAATNGCAKAAEIYYGKSKYEITRRCRVLNELAGNTDTLRNSWSTIHRLTSLFEKSMRVRGGQTIEEQPTCPIVLAY